MKAVWVLIESEQLTSGDIPELGVEPIEYIHCFIFFPILRYNVPTYTKEFLI
jgi:hypothetical protein